MRASATGGLRVAVARPVDLRRWLLACVAAETIGMTAASGAAYLARDLGVTLALTVVVAGGLVEGTALGVLQARALGPWLDGSGQRAWALVTVVVAGLGWAAASVPGVLADDDASAAPPLGLVLVGAAGLGVVMGAVLGLAQATTLRHAVRRPWRWVWTSSLAWAAAMPVIFLGATRPDLSWSLPAVLATGAATGALAGATLGAVSGLFLHQLDGGLGLRDRAVLQLLESRWHAHLPHQLVGLAVTGARTGALHRFPVQVASLHGYLVILPGHHRRKTWWRNIEAQPEVEVLRRGVWITGVASLVRPGDPRWLEACRAYRRALPHVEVASDDLWVLVDLRRTRRAP